MMNFFQSNMQTSILVLLIVLVAILCIIIFFMRKNIGSLNEKLKIHVNESLAFREATSPILNLHYTKNRVPPNTQDSVPLNNSEKKSLKTQTQDVSSLSAPEVQNTSSIENPKLKSPVISQGSDMVEDDESDYIGDTDDEEDSENEEEKEEHYSEINEIVKQAEQV